MFRLFFKKEFKEQFIIKINKSVRHPLNSLISIITYGLLMGVFLYLFIQLIKATESLKISQELLTIALFLCVVIQIVNSITTVTNYLYQSYDHFILAPLPVLGTTIVGVKMIILYLKELMSTFFIALPLMLAYGIIQQCSFSYYVIQFGILLILPIIPLVINIILSFLIVKFKHRFEKWQIIKFSLSIIITVLFFVFYQQVLAVLIELMMENKLVGLFNYENIKKVTDFCQWLIPFNYYVSLLLNQQVIFNIIIIIVINSGLVVFTLFLSRKTYHYMIKNSGENARDYRVKKVVEKSINNTLFNKEITLIMRLKEVVGSYIMVLIMLPLISYLLFSVVNSVVIKLFGGNAMHIILPFNIMFMVILVGMGNNFSACPLSREQNYFNVLKTFPVPLKKHITQKLLLSTILLQSSLLITAITLLVLKQISGEGFCYLWIITSLVGEILVVSALRRDISEPQFHESFLENANSASFIIRTILIGTIIGVFCLISGLFWVTYYQRNSVAIIYVGVILIALCSLFISFGLLYYRLEKKMGAISS